MQTSESSLEKRLELALPLAQIESEIETRLKRLARTVKLHGFRPGKVPLKIVAQQYGGQVRQEVMAESVQKTFADAVREHNFKVAGYPHFEPKQAAEDAQQLEFTATFETYPEITLGDLSGVAIVRPVAQVTDVDVDRTIEILRKQRVTYEPVDRPAEQGDQVRLDFVGTLDGQPFAGGEGKDVTAVLGEARFLPEFENQLIGLAAGESKAFELTFPGDYHGKELAGKTVSFDVKINQAAAPRLPEVDANFARSLGIEDGNLDQMRTEVRANLEREVSKRIQAKVKDQVMQALSAAAQLDVPKSLVEQEIARLASSAIKDMEARGMKTHGSQLPPELFREQAQKRVRLGLILAEVVKRNQLEAKPEQLRATIHEHAQSYEQPQEMVGWYYQNRERLAEVEAVVLEDNVVAWALATAQVEERPTGFEELMGTQGR